MFKSLFVVLCSVLFAGMARADMMSDCMAKIAKQPEFTQVLSDTIFPGMSSLDATTVKRKRNEIFTLLAGAIFANCNQDLAEIAAVPTGKISFRLNNHPYAFVFNTSDVFEFLELRTGVMVYNKRTLKAGDVIQLSDVSQLYWSKDCSDHVIWDNLNNKAAVNVAGQRVFSQYGGTDNEFFLDFEEGNNRRAFPGLVLMDKTKSTSEEIVAFSNVQSSLAASQQFADALKNSYCSNQGLAVYTVALDVQRTETNKNTWGIAASVGGGVAGVGAVLGAASAKIGSVAILGKVATAAGSVPGWGWAIAGVLAATAGAISLIPGEIQDIQQVMVIGGPYNIK